MGVEKGLAPLRDSYTKADSAVTCSRLWNICSVKLTISKSALKYLFTYILIINVIFCVWGGGVENRYKRQLF